MERNEAQAATRERALERVLIERARKGDRAAFEQLVERAFPALLRFTTGLAGRDRGLDLAQETLLRALRSIHTFRAEARFCTWLLRIARNTWLNERALLRTKKERSASETLAERVGEPFDPSKNLEQSEALEAVMQALSTLPEDQRTALLLCDRDGLSYKEIARVMDCPVGTVMSRIHYARTKVRKLLRVEASKRRRS